VSGASSRGSKKSHISTGAIAGIAVAGGILVIALIGMVLFALRQKRRVKEVTGRTDPFGKDLKTSCSFQFLLCSLTLLCERFNARSFLESNHDFRCYFFIITKGMCHSLQTVVTQTNGGKNNTNVKSELNFAPKRQFHGEFPRKTVEGLHSLKEQGCSL
jgi:hypothetical protein